MCQVPWSDVIRQEAGIATMCVGNITTADQGNTILATGRADLVAFGRPHLTDPAFGLQAAAQYGVAEMAVVPNYQPGWQAKLRNTTREQEELRDLKRKARTLPPAPTPALPRAAAWRLPPGRRHRTTWPAEETDMRIERSLAELHAEDPDRATALAFGRRGALAAIGAALGAGIPFGAHLPAGLLPAALAQAPAVLRLDGKAPLLLLGERPLVAETPETLLDDAVTPAEKMFIRNNGQIPEPIAGDPKAWRIRLDGAVAQPLDLSVGELEARFPLVTLQLQMECGGNGRASFSPETRGNQWGNGAISNGAWTGVRLRDLIAAAQPRETARFTGHFGADPHLSGATDRAAISRGMPLAKALDPGTLVALRLNGAPIPHLHGAPVRLLVPGWPGSLSQKWLTRITVLEAPHRGQGMGGTSYRLPVRPIVPGSNNDGAEFADMHSMPVRSILSSHAHGARLPAGTRTLDLRGAAWAGDLDVAAVHTSVDFGATWQAMAVAPPANPHAWQRWTGQATLPSDGYFEVWYRATDRAGRLQPHAAANWNPQGYGANAISRAAVLVG